ncbi:MAG: response regulator [Planctomycetes bacterium]|nr:response regulator [Planctomycetota bacterium]
MNTDGQVFSSAPIRTPSSEAAGASTLPSAGTRAAGTVDSLLGSDQTRSSSTIMIVDDEPINVKVVQKYLRCAGYDRFVTTNDSRQALDLMREHQPDVVVLDVVMPHVTGLDILEVVRGDLQLCHVPVLILSASSDDETKLQALEMGATDFLNKPVKPAELVPRVRNALIVKAHYDNLSQYSARLEQEVRLRTSDLTQSREEVISVLARAAEYRDRETGNHVVRVGRYANIIARALRFSETRAEMIEQGAVLHDVGKIGVPDAILLKAGKLDEEERALMRRHCEYGMGILQGMSTSVAIAFAESNPEKLLCRSPVLKLGAVIAMNHHEKWDGSGYPRGLSGEDIPIEGRIMAVADVFDALHSQRPYKEAMPVVRCLEILDEGRGKHFDPRVVEAFFASVDDILRVAFELAD